MPPITADDIDKVLKLITFKDVPLKWITQGPRDADPVNDPQWRGDRKSTVTVFAELPWLPAGPVDHLLYVTSFEPWQLLVYKEWTTIVVTQTTRCLYGNLGRYLEERLQINGKRIAP